MKVGELGMTVNEWAKDFRSFVNELQMPRDDYKGIMEYIDDVIALMKEQEAVKPVLDEQTGRIWLCGKCGSYVGFEDNDPHDPNEFDRYCRECGRPVLWKDR